TRLRGAGRDRLRPMGGAKLHRAERRCRVALVERGAVSCEHTCRRDDRERSAKNRWAVVRDRCDAAAERGHHRDTQRDDPQSSLVWLERLAGPLRPAHDRSRLYHDGRARRSALSGDCSQRAVGLMKIVVFGLTISSSWGNGHATLWRGLTKGLARLGHVVVFFERDVPYYAYHRDWHTCPNAELVLFQSFRDVREKVRAELEHADAAIVTSYCPDAALATAEIFDANRPLAVFYDLDTPITLSRVRAGETIPYLPPNGLRDFDLVLSYTGGSAASELRDLLGARVVAPLYGHVDPDVHHSVEPSARYRADLSYLGTYAADRQAVLERLFVEPARRRPQQRFLIGG